MYLCGESDPLYDKPEVPFRYAPKRYCLCGNYSILPDSNQCILKKIYVHCLKKKDETRALTLVIVTNVKMFSTRCHRHRSMKQMKKLYC